MNVYFNKSAAFEGLALNSNRNFELSVYILGRVKIVDAP